MQETEFSFGDLLFSALRKWRKAIVFALVCAAHFFCTQGLENKCAVFEKLNICSFIMNSIQVDIIDALTQHGWEGVSVNVCHIAIYGAYVPLKEVRNYGTGSECS